MLVQTGRRLGVTFVVNVEADVLRPIHISVERIVVFLAHVQATFDTLTVVAIYNAQMLTQPRTSLFY